MNLTVSQKAKLYTILTVAAIIVFFTLIAAFPESFGVIVVVCLGIGTLLFTAWMTIPTIYQLFEGWLKQKQAWKNIEDKVEPVTDIPQADIDFVKELIENFSPVEIKALKIVLKREEL
jgi:hypothetical protein